MLEIHNAELMKNGHMLSKGILIWAWNLSPSKFYRSPFISYFLSFSVLHWCSERLGDGG